MSGAADCDICGQRCHGTESLFIDPEYGCLYHVDCWRAQCEAEPWSRTKTVAFLLVLGLIVGVLWAAQAPAEASAGESYDDPAFAMGVQAATLSPWGPGPPVTAAYDLDAPADACARAGRPILVTRTCVPRLGPVERCNIGAHEALHTLYALNHAPVMRGFTHVDTPWWKSNPYCEAFRDVGTERQLRRAWDRESRLTGRIWRLENRLDRARGKIARLRGASR